MKRFQQAAAHLAASPELRVLQGLAQARRVQVFLVGGTVRELALAGASPDIDVAVSRQTLELAQDLARALGGTYVLLDEGERTARVVAGATVLDLAEFRGHDLRADLQGRDFTINALALDLAALLAGQAPELIDPLDGRADLAAGRLRMVAAANLADDPLRLLRAYRFAASHGFSVTPETAAAIQSLAPALGRVAGERVHHELFQLLAAAWAGAVLREMDRVGLLDRRFSRSWPTSKACPRTATTTSMFLTILWKPWRNWSGCWRRRRTFLPTWPRRLAGWPPTRAGPRSSNWRPCSTTSASPRCRSAAWTRRATPFITTSGWGWKFSSGPPGGCALARPRPRR
jgi:hypothetical protein